MRAISLDISDDRLHDLYEAFVREYFARHFNLTTRTRRIRWDVDAGTDYTFLPAMQADIVLEKGNSTLIIDTKYYGSILSGRIGGKISSGHLYQILAYVKNYQANNCGAKVSGMLLYAKTMTDDFNGTTWDIGHHRIDVRTLNLDQKFSVIAGSLDMIVKDYFGNITRRS